MVYYKSNYFPNRTALTSIMSSRPRTRWTASSSSLSTSVTPTRTTWASVRTVSLCRSEGGRRVLALYTRFGSLDRFGWLEGGRGSSRGSGSIPPDWIEFGFALVRLVCSSSLLLFLESYYFKSVRLTVLPLYMTPSRAPSAHSLAR
jgi:hypothetical protein